MESAQEGTEELLCVSLSQKRREGWDQETEIEKETWRIRWKRENK